MKLFTTSLNDRILIKLIFIFCISTISTYPLFSFSLTKNNTYFDVINEVNSKSDIEVISFYHKYLNQKNFAVIDKKNQNIIFFDSFGEQSFQQKILIGFDDKVESGTSGKYRNLVQNKNNYYAYDEKGILRRIFWTKSQVPIIDILYVLPNSDTKHHFRIRNDKIIFNSKRVLRNRPEYNYTSTNSKKCNPINLELLINKADPNWSTSEVNFLKDYLYSLEINKCQLMRLLNIDNHDYNQLAFFAFGVLSPESNFARHWKYNLKEEFPFLVSFLKGNYFDTSKNSRGPTQVKIIIDKLEKSYSITKEDLKNPYYAALATLAISSEMLKELRIRASENEQITEETIFNYLYYFYQGRRTEVLNSQANPNLNLSVKKIKKAYKLISITEE